MFWYKRAAEHRQPGVQNSLGYCFDIGRRAVKVRQGLSSGTKEHFTMEISVPRITLRLCAMYDYNELNQKTTDTVTYLGGISKQFRYAYQKNGLKHRFTMPDTTACDYAYGANNELRQVQKFRASARSALRRTPGPGQTRSCIRAAGSGNIPTIL